MAVKPEQWLLEKRPELAADVLVKDHHQTDWSGTTTFLEKVSPRLVIWDSDSAGLHSATIRSRLSEPPVFFDQAHTGAVRLQIRAGSLVAKGFCAPHQALTLKRAR